jgi:hypothetical protein
LVIGMKQEKEEFEIEMKRIRIELMFWCFGCHFVLTRRDQKSNQDSIPSTTYKRRM